MKETQEKDPVQAIREFEKEQEFFIGIDSDGCVFDTMEIKQKECFCPNFINSFDLQPVSKYARQVWEFVNLYSKSRGCNRFLALTRAMDLLGERKEVQERGISVPGLPELREWISEETKLGNPALIQKVESGSNKELETVLAWSLEVNRSIGAMVRNVPPFPLVRESLEQMKGKADVIVVSQTPFEALKREWEEHSIDGLIRLIAGQEMGTKSEHIAFATRGQYDKEKVLMVGDAPGDLKAARDNGALFFPINPGHEEESWERFHREALGCFFEGSYSGAYEEGLIGEFQGFLPENPPWKG
jgi:phosphoglycolate phosphatase-like HAD superfamily hydrolase